MKRLSILFLLAVMCCVSLAYALESSEPEPLQPDAEVVEENYEVGAVRVLVYENVKKEKDRAKIYINDEDKGVSPIYVQGLQPGEYSVKVKGGKSTWIGTAKVEAGKTIGVDVTLDGNDASAELYEVLLWEDFLDNRNDWGLKPGSLIIDGQFIAKTQNALEYYLSRSYVFQDLSLEASFQVQSQRTSGTSRRGPEEVMPDTAFGFVYRAKGTATVILFEASGRQISRYYLINFEDIDYFSRPVIIGGDLKVKVKDSFRVKTILRHDELQIFIDGKLVAITQVKYTNEGNIGLAIGPGLKVQVDHLTVGKV